MLSRRIFLQSSLAGVPFSLLGRGSCSMASAGTIVRSPSNLVKRDYWNDWPAYLTRKWNEARSYRESALRQLVSKEKVLERGQWVRDRVWELIGGQLEKTPLNPRRVGEIERTEYRIEKTIFESQPQVFVTSHLYIPKVGSPPYPGVLFSMGHASEGKLYRSYQHMCQTLASKGYVVLAFDPFGQGERVQYLDEHAQRSRLGDPIYEHLLPGKQLLLLGTTFTQLRAWDGIRALDYLLSRSEVDPRKIGCVGQSGGGTMTMYLVALEPRIQVAVPVEGNFTNFTGARFNPPGAVADAEQNMIGNLPLGIDRGDLLLAFAPKPLLMCFTAQDYSSDQPPNPEEAPLEVFGELKRAYTASGTPDRVEIFQSVMPHSLDFSCRKATISWFNRWLAQQDRGSDEAPYEEAPSEALNCAATGQILVSVGGRSVADLIRERAKTAASRSFFRDASAHLEVVRRRVRETLKKVLGLPEVRHPLNPQVLGSTHESGLIIEEFHISSEPEIRIPGWFVRPREGKSAFPTVLVLTDTGKNQAVTETGIMMELARKGFAVCCLDLRGLGETAPARPSDSIDSPDWEPLEDSYAWAGFMLGKPVLGQRVWDFLRSLDYLENRPDVDRNQIKVYGVGGAGLVTLLGSILDGRPQSILLEHMLTDYRSVVEKENYATPLSWFVYGVLREFDLPDLLAALAPRPCWLVNSIDSERKVLPELAVRSLYQSACRWYSEAASPDHLRFFVQPEARMNEVLQEWLDISPL